MRKGDGPTAFYPQSGWVMPGTLRYNITLRSEAGSSSILITCSRGSTKRMTGGEPARRTALSAS